MRHLKHRVESQKDLSILNYKIRERIKNTVEYAYVK